MTKDELNTYIARLFGMSETAIDKMNGKVDRAMIETMKSSLKDVQGELASMYEKYGDSVTLQDMNKYKRLQSMEGVIQEHLTEMGKEVKKQIKGNIQDNFKAGYYHAGYAVESPMNINLGFSGLNPDNVRASIINPYDRIRWSDALANHVTALNTRVRREIATGLVQGFGYSKTARNIRKGFELTTYQANRIVRTEAHRAKSMGRNLAFKKSRDQPEHSLGPCLVPGKQNMLVVLNYCSYNRYRIVPVYIVTGFS